MNDWCCNKCLRKASEKSYTDGWLAFLVLHSTRSDEEFDKYNVPSSKVIHLCNICKNKVAANDIEKFL